MYHYFHYDDAGNYEIPEENIFEKAVELLFPDLDKDDPRCAKVISFAQDQYRKNGKGIVLLCTVNGANSKSLRRVTNFLTSLDLDAEKREVIVSDGKLFFTKDYKTPPVCIS